MPNKRISRRRFAAHAAGLSASGAVALGQSKPNPDASAEKTKQQNGSLPASGRSRAISEFDVPMSTEPAFTFKA